ncbi:MAG: hypothetical protein ABF267_09080 [Glaciecola sp.]|jgi:F0F1-type ATP synthase beta subunit
MDKQSLGYIVSVRGTVVDIEFATQLPQVRHVLKAGPERNVSLEVQTQLNEHTVQAIALNPTSGLAKYCIQQQRSGTANKSQTYIYFTIVPVLPQSLGNEQATLSALVREYLFICLFVYIKLAQNL